MCKFNLTSPTEEPTDEQLEYIMRGVAEEGRRNMENAHAVIQQRLQETVRAMRAFR